MSDHEVHCVAAQEAISMDTLHKGAIADLDVGAKKILDPLQVLSAQLGSIPFKLQLIFDCRSRHIVFYVASLTIRCRIKATKETSAPLSLALVKGLCMVPLQQTLRCAQLIS